MNGLDGYLRDVTAISVTCIAPVHGQRTGGDILRIPSPLQSALSTAVPQEFERIIHGLGQFSLR